MKTLFYVPLEEDIEPYVKEATLWQLPIIHGISERLKTDYPDFVFPETADIIKLPEQSYMERSEEDFVLGNVAVFLFVEEFVDLRKVSLKFKVENARSQEVLLEDVEPQWVEASRARWVTTFEKIGKYRFVVTGDDKELADDTFYVYAD